MNYPAIRTLTKAGPTLRRPLRRALVIACVALIVAIAALGGNIANAAPLTIGG